MNAPIDFERYPLVPAVIQDDRTRDVLMIGFMNRDAFERTLESGFVHFWSRSRNRLWMKGETSGHTQEVVSMSVNCEDNSLLVQVIQHGAVCHTGHTSCFYRQILPDGSLFETRDPVFDPAAVYGPGAGLLDRWFGAYRFLRDQDLGDRSSTSRRLRSGAPPPLDRVADELEEFAGVLRGDHRHSRTDDDLMLEASQVYYWVALSALMSGLESRDVDFLGTHGSGGYDPLSTDLVSHIADLAGALRRTPPGDVASLVNRAVRLVRLGLEPAGFTASDVLERDLADMRNRPYLADYFAGSG